MDDKKLALMQKTDTVIEKCVLKVKVIELNEIKLFTVNVAEKPFQKEIVGKKIGESFTLNNLRVSYEILEIFREPKNILEVLNSFNFEGFHHYTSFKNFINIIQSKKLCSRNRIENIFPEFCDAASKNVISKTTTHVKDMVRFYYRGQTPTFYKNEGIKLKPIDENEETAHMPIPVLLLFSKNLLNYDGRCFSNKNCASNYVFITNQEQEAMNFDWEKIFSIGPTSIEDRFEIKQRRNAEFLLPDEINLDDLIAIIFRSEADKKHAEIVLGKNPLYKINPKKFFAPLEFDIYRNYLVNYSQIDETQHATLEFHVDASQYIHKLIIYYENGQIDKKTLKLNKTDSNKAKIFLPYFQEGAWKIEYILSGTESYKCDDVSAVWEKK